MIHPVFHVSLLKQFHGDNPTTISPLPELVVDEQPVLEPELALRHRVIQVQGKPKQQVLIKWKYLPSSEASWEWVSDVVHSFPTFNVEDKVVADGDGIVMNQEPVSADPRPKRERKEPAWTKDYLMK